MTYYVPSTHSLTQYTLILRPDITIISRSLASFSNTTRPRVRVTNRDCYVKFGEVG